MTFWDDRYSETGYAYGKEPNDFLRESFRSMPPGKVLCLAEGEGRNAVFLATQGYEVTAVDQSAVGLTKARALAEACGVRITTVQSDLDCFEIEPGAWQGIVSIWAHVPSALRAKLHARCVAGLAPRGVFLLEAYNPKQLEKGTGGPTERDRLMDVASVRQELTGLHFHIARECDRLVREGSFHNGLSAVTQILAEKLKEGTRQRMNE